MAPSTIIRRREKSRRLGGGSFRTRQALIPWRKNRTKYTYDIFNRLIARTVSGSGAGDNAGTQRFVYDGKNPVLTFDVDGNVTDRYLWGPAVDQVLADENYVAGSHGESGNGGLPTAAGTTQWTLGDNQNSVRDIVGDNGTLLNHIAYTPFGQQLNGSYNPQVMFAFGYTGTYTDVVTGDQLHGVRWYDPQSQRWLTQDPAAADANLYRYCGNAPGNGTDPSGLEVIVRDDKVDWTKQTFKELTGIEPKMSRCLTSGLANEDIFYVAVIPRDKTRDLGLARQKLDLNRDDPNYDRNKRLLDAALSFGRHVLVEKNEFLANPDGPPTQVFDFGNTDTDARLAGTFGPYNIAAMLKALKDAGYSKEEIAQAAVAYTSTLRYDPVVHQDTIAPWYRTEDEAIVANWIKLADRGEWLMLLFGPGGMGETGLMAATPFAKGNVMSPLAEIERPPETVEVRSGECHEETTPSPAREAPAAAGRSTALVPGVVPELRLNPADFTAAERAAIDFKYSVANGRIAVGAETSEVGSQVPYNSYLSRRFVRDTLQPGVPVKDVRVPSGFQVDEFVSRQYGGRQVPENQWLMPNESNLNQRLGPLEKAATQHLPDGTPIRGWRVIWEGE